MKFTSKWCWECFHDSVNPWYDIVAVCYISHNFNMLPIPTPSRNALANISFCDDVKYIRLFAK